MERNVILADCDPCEVEPFRAALEEASGLKWSASVCVSNGSRAGAFGGLKRYLLYAWFPLKTALSRRHSEGGCVVAWQQFYGIFYAFFCRLLHMKKRDRLVVMTFIYKKKPGWIGRLYHSFMRYSLQGEYIDLLTCTARAEMAQYAELFGIDERRFRFVPWGVIDYSEGEYGRLNEKQPFLFAPGRSNRDWDFLIDSLKDSGYRTMIACDELKPRKAGSVEIRNDISDQSLYQHLKDCFCVLISADDPNISAGQTVLILAMMFGKPLIVTESMGLTRDYAQNGFNALVIPKRKQDLLGAVNRLMTDPALYGRLSKQGILEYHEKYTKTALGRNLWNAIQESGCA